MEWVLTWDVNPVLTGVNFAGILLVASHQAALRGKRCEQGASPPCCGAGLLCHEDEWAE